MKFLFFLSFSFFVSTSEWLTDFSQAQQEASQTGKMILLNFSGSDWCSPCINLKKKIFESEEFSSYAGGNLILVNADFPRLKKNRLNDEQIKRNDSLADRYNPQGVFPYTVLVNGEGAVLKEWSGLPVESAAMFVQEIKKVTHAGN
jgi:thioredoxin-related protein